MGTYGLNSGAVSQTANQTGKGNRKAYITSLSRKVYYKAYIISLSRRLYFSKPKRKAYITYNLTNYPSRAKPSGIGTKNNIKNNINTNTKANTSIRAGANTGIKANINIRANTRNNNINTNNTNT